jgi:hypothetical protein
MQMRATVDIDADLQKQLGAAQNATGEKQATVIRLALRAGLPVVINRFQSPRPEGYFSEAYKNSERVSFERKMYKSSRQRPER